MEQSRVVSVAVGSENPVKLRVASVSCAEALGAVRIVAVPNSTGVPEQPRSDEETLWGAVARARAAMVGASAELGMGIESGVAPMDGGLFAFTWVAVCDQGGAVGRACSARLELPSEVVRELERGSDLEQAIERVTGIARAGRAGGAMGLATAGRVTRFDAALQAARFALVRFAPGPFSGT